MTTRKYHYFINNRRGKCIFECDHYFDYEMAAASHGLDKINSDDFNDDDERSYQIYIYCYELTLLLPSEMRMNEERRNFERILDAYLY